MLILLVQNSVLASKKLFISFYQYISSKTYYLTTNNTKCFKKNILKHFVFQIKTNEIENNSLRKMIFRIFLLFINWLRSKITGA